MTDKIEKRRATFAVPYNGEDNNDHVNGKGFCCNDGSLEAAQARALSRAAKNNFQEGDAYEKMQFYYHPDHLGSSSYITNLDGEVVQHIEYVPFGEVFIEERNNIWNTPYLFNAKEFDEETGLYYYGARYYDPRLSLWMSTDPMQEKYPWITSFCYTFNNPIKFIDPDGNDYDEIIDDKSITFKAVIFVTKDSYEAAKASAGILNQQSGKWTYDFAIQEGDQKTEYSLNVNFNVTVELAEQREGYPTRHALQSALNKNPGETCLNTFEVVPDDKMGILNNGSTSGGNYIQIKKSRIGTETGAHEIGHAMGLQHSSEGLMTSESSNPRRNNNLDKGSISDMIKYPLKGKVNTRYNPEKGESIPAGKGTLINNSKFTVKQLLKGKVKSLKLKMSNSFYTTFNIVAQICATMLFFSCASLRNKVYNENKLTKELSAYIVDTVYIDNPSIIEFNDIRYVVDLSTDSIPTKKIKKYLNHTVHYVLGDNIFYDLPPHLYEKVLNYPDYGNCDFSVEVQKKNYNILCFKTRPKLFIIVALNIAYFNKKYSSIDAARFIKSYSPLNTYILLAYPLCE